MSRVGEIITMDDGSWCPVWDDGTPAPGTVLFAEQPAQGEAVALTGDQIERHSLNAGECPPNSQVILVSSIRRLAARNTAPPAPSVPNSVEFDGIKTSVPDGWKLVPIVADDAIEQAAADWIGYPCKAGELWNALLAAAPEVKP